MIHISWWFLLSGLAIYLIYFIIGIIIILSTGIIEYIIFKIQTKRGKQINSYESKAIKLLNLFETKKLEHAFLIIQICILIFIPINNLVFYIRMEAKTAELRLNNNINFLNNQSYHYYEVISMPSGSNNENKISRNASAFYTLSTKKLEEIKDLPIIRINKYIYVKPSVITEISKKEFIKYTRNINLEKDF